MGLNVITMTGNLTRDVQLTFLPSGTPVAEFGIACNKVWKDKDGNKKERVCFVECRCYSKRAEALANYFSKGDAIGIAGELQFDSWEAQDGTKRSKHRIFVENFEFMPTGTGGGEREQGQQGDSSEAPF